MVLNGSLNGSSIDRVNSTTLGRNLRYILYVDLVSIPQ